jgi:hypothetical protein
VEDPTEPADGETAATADEVTGEPTEGADPTSDPKETGDTQTAETGEATGAADSTAQAEGQATARSQKRPLSSQEVPEPVLDPRASAGDVNCLDMTRSVTLDNSRSTIEVFFWVRVDDSAYSVYPFALSGGATEVIQIPVIDGSGSTVSVTATDPSDDDVHASLAYSFVRVNCTLDGPRASIGDADCTALAVAVTLDNSQSVIETTFWVATWRYEPVQTFSNEAVVVPAGETRVIQIAPPLFVDDRFRVLVAVALSEEASESDPLVREFLGIDCAPVGEITTATVGDLDCNTRTIPVTIDNSAVNREITDLYVHAEYLNAALEPHPFVRPYIVFQVTAGEMRIVRVPIPRSNYWRAVRVFVVNGLPQTTLDDNWLAERIIHLNCPDTAARPTAAVKGAKLPATGGFNLSLPLLGVALLAGGTCMLALSGHRRRY